MPYRGTLSNKKIKKTLNFNPKFNLEKGVKKLILWYQNNHLNELKKED